MQRFSARALAATTMTTTAPSSLMRSPPEPIVSWLALGECRDQRYHSRPPDPSRHPGDWSSRAMEAGIVGLPNVGKSTLFNALTKAKALAANYPFATIEPNVGIVAVPDRQLGRINAHQPTEKIVPATLRIVDIAGIVRGASKGEGLGNKFLTHIREVDAIVHVVRCFEDAGSDPVTHVEGSVDPLRDIATIETELILADMQLIENALPRLERAAKSKDSESPAKIAVLQKRQPILESGKPARGVTFTNLDQEKAARGFGFLSAKAVLYVANVGEDDLKGEGPLASMVRAHAAAEGMQMIP